jgi:hypothetical protein
MSNKPQKPQLNIPVVSGSFYWIKPFHNSEFEPAKARLDYRDEICFAFTDGSTMSIDAVWEVEPLNYR